MWITSIIVATVVAVVLCIVYTILYKILFSGMDGYFNLNKIQMSSMFHGNALMPTNNFVSLSVNAILNTVVFVGMILLSHFLSWGLWIASFVMLISMLLSWFTYNGRKNTAYDIRSSVGDSDLISKLLGVYIIAPLHSTILFVGVFVVNLLS